MSAGQDAAASLTPATTIHRSADWLSAKVGEELIMMNGSTGRYIGLTETGSRIWELLAAPLTLAALCAELAKEYDATAAQVAGDVAVFIRELLANGAVSLEPGV